MDAAPAPKTIRARFPRSEQSRLADTSRDPVAILSSQNATRIPDLVPVRFGRMLQSPFAFLRGAAAVMATDLAASGSTDLRVAACGDAHIGNFGFFASPERDLLFDLNDFDEAAVAPWEWDLKRLVASVYVAGRDIGLREDQCQESARATATAYRQTLRQLMEQTALERFYARVDADLLESLAASAGQAKGLRKVIDKARSRTSEQVLRKIGTVTQDGELRIAEAPPLLRRVDLAAHGRVRRLADSYAGAVREDVAYLLSQFRLADVALRVVGVGSVGTRCYVVALQGPAGEPLFLQVKEASPSVLVTYGGMPDLLPGSAQRTPDTQGHRVVAGQRILQAFSDPFLGWIAGTEVIDETPVPVHFYWRQFRDMKGSIELAGLKARGFERLAVVCAGLLARAHSQSPAAAGAAAYLGSSDRADEAFAAWGRAYADVTEGDHAALGAAVRRGEVAAEYGV